MIPVISRYKDNEYPRPKSDTDPKKKDADYHRAWASWLYSLYLRGQCAWGVNGYEAFQEWRDYSLGRQSTDRYKVWLTNDVDTGSSTTPVAVDSFDDLPLTRRAKRDGWYSILWDNISPAPAVLDALHGQFDKLDHDLYVNVIDPESKDIEENEAYLKLFEGLNLDWQNEFKTKAGIPIDENTFYPRSIQEFEMMKSQDGFKLNVARSMQKVLRYSFELAPGSWDTVTRKKVIDDFICLGYGAVRDYFDSEDNKFKQKWIDPARLVIQYSNEYDYNDAEYAGYFTYQTVSHLRRILPGVPEEKWFECAKGSLGYYGNPKSGWENRYSKLDPSTQSYGYDGFKVPVFEAEWIDMDVKKRQYYESWGRRYVRDLDYTDKGKNTEKKQVKQTSIRLVRQCSWVVGTDYCYDWGVLKMASRKNYSKPQLTFHVEQLLQPSLIERLRPILDQIELTFLKYQNSLAMMAENGYAINTAMLSNVSLGGKKLSVREVIKLHRTKGYLLYQYSPGTGLYTGGVATPITPIEGGMKTRVEETMATLVMWMNTIKTMTGIDVVALANTPVASDTEEIKQEQVQVTLDVVKPILDATVEIKQSCGECLMRRIQTGVRNSDAIRKAYSGVISKADMEALTRMSSDGTQFGLSLKARPDRKAKIRFEKWIDIALQNTRENRPGININEAMKFSMLLDAGVDIDELTRMFDYAVIKNAEEAQAKAEKMIQVQGEQQRETDAQKAQIELEKIKTEGEIAMQEELIRGQIKERESNKQIAADLYNSLREEVAAEKGINISGNR